MKKIEEKRELKEIQNSIRRIQKSIAETRESLQYQINDLDAVRKSILVLDLEEQESWRKDIERPDISRYLKG